MTRMVFLFALTLLITGGDVIECEAIEFNTFDQAKGIELAGSAAVYKHALRLTPAKHSQTGAAWLTEKQTVFSHFETIFQFQFTHFCRFGGADGLAFVMQSAGPDAIGGRGSAGGFGVASRMYRNRSGIRGVLLSSLTLGRTATKGTRQTTTSRFEAMDGLQRCAGQQTVLRSRRDYQLT
jgi:Bacterial lectin